MWSQWPTMAAAVPVVAPPQPAVPPPLPDAPPPPPPVDSVPTATVGTIGIQQPAVGYVATSAGGTQSANNPYEQYTAAQYAAMTPEQQYALQQHWQQWQTYQQEYAKWHAQYGEQYKREMAAAAATSAGVPTAAVAVAVAPVAEPFSQAQVMPPMQQLTTQPQPPPQSQPYYQRPQTQQPQMQALLPGKIMAQPQMYNQPPPPPPQGYQQYQQQPPNHWQQQQQQPPPGRYNQMPPAPFNQAPKPSTDMNVLPNLQQPPPSFTPQQPQKQQQQKQQQPGPALGPEPSTSSGNPNITQWSNPPPNNSNINRNEPERNRWEGPPTDFGQQQQNKVRSNRWTGNDQSESSNIESGNNNNNPNPFNNRRSWQNDQDNSNTGNNNNNNNRNNQFAGPSKFNAEESTRAGNFSSDGARSSGGNFGGGNYNVGNSGPGSGSGPGTGSRPGQGSGSGPGPIDNYGQNNNFGNNQNRRSGNNNNNNNGRWEHNRQQQGPGNFGPPFNNNFNNNNNNNNNNNYNDNNFNRGPNQNNFNQQQQQQQQQHQQQQQQQNRAPDMDEASFDRLFEKWENQFEDWKRANANHPDRDEYRRYEEEFEKQRRRIAERREQMRRRRQMQNPQNSQSQQQQGLSDVDAGSSSRYDDFEQQDARHERNINKAEDDDLKRQAVPSGMRPGTAPRNEPMPGQNESRDLENKHAYNKETEKVEQTQLQRQRQQGQQQQQLHKEPPQQQQPKPPANLAGSKAIPYAPVALGKLQQQQLQQRDAAQDKGAATAASSLGKRKNDTDDRVGRAPSPAKQSKQDNILIISLDDDDDDVVIEKSMPQQTKQPAAESSGDTPMKNIFKRTDGIPGLDLVAEGAAAAAQSTDADNTKKIPSLFDVVIVKPGDKTQAHAKDTAGRVPKDNESLSEDVNNALKDPEFMNNLSQALAQAQGREREQQQQQSKECTDSGENNDGRPLSFAEWQRKKNNNNENNGNRGGFGPPIGPGFNPNPNQQQGFGGNGPGGPQLMPPNFNDFPGPAAGNFGPNGPPNGPNFSGPNFNRGGPPPFGGNNGPNEPFPRNFGPGGPGGPNFNGPNFGPNFRPNFCGPNGPGPGPNFGGPFGGGPGGNFGPNERNFGPGSGHGPGGNAPNERKFRPGPGPGHNNPNDRNFGNEPNHNNNFNGPNNNNSFNDNPFRRNGGPPPPNFNDNAPDGPGFGQPRGKGPPPNQGKNFGQPRNSFGNAGNNDKPWTDGADQIGNRHPNEPIFRPMQVFDYQNSRNAAAKVIDYGHKSVDNAATATASGMGFAGAGAGPGAGGVAVAGGNSSSALPSFRPVNTFDYGHASHNAHVATAMGREPVGGNMNRNPIINNNNKKKKKKNKNRQRMLQQQQLQEQTGNQAAGQSVKSDDLEDISDGEDNLANDTGGESPPPPPPTFKDDQSKAKSFPANPQRRILGEPPTALFPSTAAANQEIPKQADASRLLMSVPTNENRNTISIDEVLLPPGRLTRPKRLCIILRGPPGSGKSYVARLIKEKELEMGGANPRILSIDDYFIIENDYEEKCPKTGKKIPKKEVLYEYDDGMEETYMQYLIKSFKKTLSDNLYELVIVDCNNNSLRTLNEFYCNAKDSNFVPYIIDLHCDLETCLGRNSHQRSESDIRDVLDNWCSTPLHYIKLDVATLLENVVEMEDVENMATDDNANSEMAEPGLSEPVAVDEDDSNSADAANDCGFLKSKWENDTTEENLARLDGTKRLMKKRKTASMADYLQLDDWEPPKASANGKKRVRWADIEEKRAQQKMRAIGFVVGQTDWKRMMDPNAGNRALNKTKYIERVNKRR